MDRQSDFLLNAQNDFIYENNNNQSLVSEIINLIKCLNIKIIAFDFDCTIVNIHTGGQWLDSAEKLAEFVRPCFRDLIPVLLKCADLNTCVVTYSPQEKLIKDVLRISIKDNEYDDASKLLDRLVIKGNTKEFLFKYGLETCYTNGKQPHLDYCKDYFLSLKNNNNNNNNNNKYEINNSSILLIDDDVTNLKIALENGHLAFQCMNNVKLIDLFNYLRDKYESFSSN